jgi:hypothetical protein
MIHSCNSIVMSWTCNVLVVITMLDVIFMKRSASSVLSTTYTLQHAMMFWLQHTQSRMMQDGPMPQGVRGDIERLSSCRRRCHKVKGEWCVGGGGGTLQVSTSYYTLRDQCSNGPAPTPERRTPMLGRNGYLFYLL